MAAAPRVPDAFRVKALASTLHQSVVPIIRAAVQLPTTAHGERVVERMVKRVSPPKWTPPETYLDSLRD